MSNPALDPVRPRRPFPAGCRTAASLLGSVLLAACVTVPEPAAVQRPQALADLQAARSLQAPAGEWPSQDWWKTLGDSQLDQLMDEALAQAPSMAQAQARLRAAVARSQGARAPLLPAAAVDAAAGERKLSYNGAAPAVPRGWNDYGTASLGLGWELDFWGKHRSALDAAVSEARAAQADAAAARVLLATELAQRYVALDGLHVRQSLARKTLANRQDSARLAMRRVAAGLDMQVAFEQARSRTLLAQAELAAVEEQLQLARHGIAALLGRGPDRGLAIQPPRLAAPQPARLPADLTTDLLGRKPEIVAARWRVEAAAERVGVARAGFYPSVNLFAFVGLESLGLERLFDAGSDTGNAGAALHLPIFEGGLLRARYSQAWAEYEFAVASYDAALVQSLWQAADALRSLQALPARLDATQVAVLGSERAYQLARRRYEGGLADYQTVLSTEDAVLQAQTALSALQVRARSLDIALTQALGGGFSQGPALNEQVIP